ncbi:MAG: hypothetical protein LBQ12_11105 [Deltaproteobacteria bacterium]|jgi:hypothetical protein|nr:hypothetical protein [Deltaproteobacteria bacterium]
MPSQSCPSRSVSWFSVLVAAAAAEVSAALAPVYAAAVLYSSDLYAGAPWLNPAFAALYGAATGLAAGAAAKATLTFNPASARLLAMLGGWAGFALSWAAWLGFLVDLGTGFPGLARLGSYVSDGGWALLLTEPAGMTALALDVSAIGVWSLGQSSPEPVNGLPLVCAWLAEFAAFTFFCRFFAARGAVAPRSIGAGGAQSCDARLPLGEATSGRGRAPGQGRA